MLKILVLEDNDFVLIKYNIDSLELDVDIQVLNDESEQNIEFNDIHQLIDKYIESGGFDLLLVDLQIPDSKHNGLLALRSWVKKNHMTPNELNFGIIGITNHIGQEADTALGGYPKYFGNCFLGVAPKDEDFHVNLSRLISNAFIVPPFIRGGNKYFNTRLLKEQFGAFSQSFRIGDTEYPFHRIIAVQYMNDDRIRFYTDTGIHVPKEGSVKKFFADHCYDAFKEYTYDPLEWENSGYAKEQIVELSRARICEYIQTSFPAFICVGGKFAVNPLYIKSINTFKDYKLNDLSLIGLIANKEIVDRSTQISGTVCMSYLILKDGRHENIFIPLYGRTFDKIKDDNKGQYRIRNTFHDRWFLFSELTSNKWSSVIKQLQSHFRVSILSI